MFSAPLKKELKVHARRASDFLSSPCIRRQDGSMLAGFNLKKRTGLHIYHEITGYAVSSTLECYRFWHEESFLEQAHRSAAYLQKLMSRQDGSPFKGFSQGFDAVTGRTIERFFSFDSAIILQGFSDFYQHFPSEQLLTAIRTVAGWLIDEMQMPDGSFRAFRDGTGAVAHAGKVFYFDGSCIHAKIAIGLLKAYAILNDERLLAAARKVCDWVLSLQNRNTGAFYTNAYKNHIFAHAHCYTVEALLFTYGHTGNRRYRESALEGARFLAAIQLPSGGVAQTPLDRRSIKDGIKKMLFSGGTTDATAQAMRIWLIADAMRGAKRFEGNIERAARWLIGEQLVDDKGTDVTGSFYYQRRELLHVPFHSSTLYVWCAQFALSAFLRLLEDDRASDNGLQSHVKRLF